MQNYIDEEVGKRLRNQRILKGKNQSELANEIGVTFQQIQKYEKGTNRISASRLYTIAQVLRVSIPYFFQGLEEDHYTGKSEKNDKQSDENILNSEAQELVEAYYRIHDPKIRKSIFELMKSIDKTFLKVEKSTVKTKQTLSSVEPLVESIPEAVG